jgi:hypothetical protein
VHRIAETKADDMAEIFHDILKVLKHGCQPNRAGLRNILSGNLKKRDAERYKTERALIGHTYSISGPRLGGILDVLLLFDLIAYYKGTSLLEITELGGEVLMALEKQINLPKILKIGVKSIGTKTSSRQNEKVER